ncbi:MAG: CBS domain-containing protein [Candidatus Binatia bacterium]
MRKTIPVSEYMSGLPEEIDRRDVLSEAIRRMRTHHIRHLPVMDGPHIYGIISRSDVYNAWLRHGPSAGDTAVAECCTPNPLMVSPLAPIPEVARQMIGRGVTSVLVAEEGVLVGIFTSVDALQVLADLAAPERAG